MERMPRKMLTAWVDNTRPRGRPQFTIPHSIHKALDGVGLKGEFKDWSKLAQDRREWRRLTNTVNPYGGRDPAPGSGSTGTGKTARQPYVRPTPPTAEEQRAARQWRAEQKRAERLEWSKSPYYDSDVDESDNPISREQAWWIAQRWKERHSGTTALRWMPVDMNGGSLDSITEDLIAQLAATIGRRKFMCYFGPNSTEDKYSR